MTRQSILNSDDTEGNTNKTNQEIVGDARLGHTPPRLNGLFVQLQIQVLLFHSVHINMQYWVH